MSSRKFLAMIMSFTNISSVHPLFPSSQNSDKCMLDLVTPSPCFLMFVSNFSMFFSYMLHSRLFLLTYFFIHLFFLQLSRTNWLIRTSITFFIVISMYFFFLEISDWSFEVYFVLLLLLSCFSCVRLCATPQMAAYQAPLSLGFSRQEHWSGLPFPSPMQESEK